MAENVDNILAKYFRKRIKILQNIKLCDEKGHNATLFINGNTILL